jgi:hypothetical protein
MESMEPGDYAILVDFDWTSEMAQREFVVSSYGTKDVFFLKDEGQTVSLEAVLGQLFKGFVRLKLPQYQPKVIALKDIKDFMI